jgi:hypothetical protein
MITEQGSDAVIGRQPGIWGNHFDSAVHMEDRLHHGFSEFDGGDLATTQRTLEMGLGSEGTTGATAPTLTPKILVQHQLVHTGGIDRF